MFQIRMQSNLGGGCVEEFKQLKQERVEITSKDQKGDV